MAVALSALGNGAVLPLVILVLFGDMTSYWIAVPVLLAPSLVLCGFAGRNEALLRGCPVSAPTMPRQLPSPRRGRLLSAITWAVAVACQALAAAFALLSLGLPLAVTVATGDRYGLIGVAVLSALGIGIAVSMARRTSVPIKNIPIARAAVTPPPR